ncbi:hypothetical protein QUF64_05425 [Anaerolineales bacterium HSG6]|nr:hypothetical protein [Anaerolineales bacterium HSG6]
MTEQSGKTHWHQILGKLFELLFTATDVTVQVDFKLMSEPPRGDILLLRRNSPIWTTSQLARLPDGIRNSQASHILIEFKYTESLNPRRLEKAHGYDIIYRETQGLADDEVASFILCSKTPRQALLEAYSYQPTVWPGVYHSNQPMVARVGLLVLNQLSDASHNAYVKCFASRNQPKRAAFDVLNMVGGERLSNEFWQFISGLGRLILPDKEETMLELEITPEDIMNLGKGVREGLLSTFSAEERLSGLKPTEVLSQYKPEERLVGLKPEEVLSQYEPEERLVGLKPTEVLSQYKPEERLVGLKPEEVLSQYEPEEVLSQYEPYLEEREQQAEYKLMLKTVRRTLRIRFKLSDEVLDNIDKQLQMMDITTLETLSEVALTTETVTDFETKLHSLLPPAEPSGPSGSSETGKK